MPQSLSEVYVHLIFSTKGRQPLLADSALRHEAHAYLGEISNRLKCPALQIGGMEDHVHVLSRLSPTIASSEWVKELKRVSSKWLKEEKRVQEFAWQSGYALLSVGSDAVQSVRRYVANQEEHHKKHSFQDEFLAILKLHKVEYDPKYLWD